jgi:hypothetical protein
VSAINCIIAATKFSETLENSSLNQGCQMVYFQTKNPNLGKFWRALELKMLVYFVVIWNILRPFDILYGHYVGNVVVIWHIFHRSGILCQEKAGNPVLDYHFLVNIFL